MKKIVAFVLLLQFLTASSQEYFPKNDGVKSENENYTAFTNAKIHISPDQVIEKGTLIIQKGKVVASGKGISIPKNSTTIDLNGKSIYPSFIDVFSNFGIQLPKMEQGGRRGTQYDSKRKGYYWNEHIRPETEAAAKFKFDDKKAKELLKEGFGVVNTHFQDGIVRGNGMLVALNTEGSDNQRILNSRSAQYLSFSKSKYHKQVYPTSLMGSIALLNQMYYDASWYQSQGSKATTDLSLEALENNKNLTQIFYAGDKSNALRAFKIGKTFGINYILFGGGNEYELIQDIKATNATYILPLNFPKAYDVENPFSTNYVSLGDMKHWNQAPANPGILDQNGIRFALSSHGLKSVSEFKKNLSKAIQYGLDKKTALAALTTIPANILNKSNELGNLNKGALANFLITSGDVFDEKTIIYENWVQGKPFTFESLDRQNIDGNYALKIGNDSYDLSIKNSMSKLKVEVKKEGKTISQKSNYKNNWLSINLQIKDAPKQFTRLYTLVKNDGDLSGKAVSQENNDIKWTAVKSSDAVADKQKKDVKTPYLSPVSSPNMAYGFDVAPEQQSILFKNVTVWTNEDEGILENSDVLIKDGKIAKIGKDLKAGKALEIDGTGKHLTSGIIDEHTHIATVSVNEAGHNSTAEVSMEDAIDHEDINIYRNLAGGVTEAQVLHGSANPIGGRSAVIKLKWGETPEKMIDPNAAKFIKFALGENVKQSNWNSTSRFPQTRMGVEQVYQDYFQRAKEYDKIKKSGAPYRTDIEMEVLAEIINKERFISCHSYVQSEINMLMKVAESFDFNVNTFTHILEGYKVADKMKVHGAGGSTFSDWWAYKYEVNDAIPYNAAIMHSQGVVTAINSDDAEMSRRLNQEAAKSVKYGGVSEEEAWKFVTLNPAKLLHIDNKVGSIKVGKDADLVLWTDHPMAVHTRAEKTLIEGKVYFDLERDAELRKNIQTERNTLINLMLAEKSKGKPTQKPKKKENRLNHCDTVEF